MLASPRRHQLGMTDAGLISWDRVADLRSEIGEDDFAEVVALFLSEVEETLTRLSTPLPAPALADESMAIVLGALNRPRDADELRGAVLDMRVKVAAEHSSGLKHAPGGLVDIDFVVQYAMLRTGIADGTTGTRQLIRRLASAGALGEAEAEALLGALILMQNLGQVFAIAGGVEDLAAAPTVLQRILLRAGEAPDIGFLTADLAERQAAIRAILEHEIGVLAEAG